MQAGERLYAVDSVLERGSGVCAELPSSDWSAEIPPPVGSSSSGFAYRYR